MRVMVRDGNGSPIEAEKLADITVEVGGHRFACMVTRMYQGLPDLTHTASGGRVCPVTYRDLAAANRDHKAAARLAFNRLVEKHGADRVAAVLLGAGG